MKEEDMIEETAKLHALAWRLIGHEGGDGADPIRMADAADKVCQKLSERLAIIIGKGGFSAILEHAVKLTRADFPFLPVDLAAQDGQGLKRLQESAQDMDPIQLSAVLTSLWANFLVSLVSLIGRDLSCTFLRAVWPEIEMD